MYFSSYVNQQTYTSDTYETIGIGWFMPASDST